MSGEISESEDEPSLTANDFEILGRDNFYERMSQAFSLAHKFQNKDLISIKPDSEKSKLKGEGGLLNSGNLLKSLLNKAHSSNLNDNDSSYSSASQDCSKDTHALSKGVSFSALSLPFEKDEATGLPKMPEFDKQLNYFEEYWNVYLQN